MPAKLIYTNPRTQPQTRQVLQQINQNFGLIDTDIADLTGKTYSDTGTAGEALSAGEVVRFSGGNIIKAQADSTTNAAAVGLATAAIANGASGTFAHSGVVTNSGWSLTPGAQYFLSGVTAGALVTAPDDTSTGAVAKPIGIALSATELLVNIQPGVVYS